jgi:hypothetical protein
VLGLDSANASRGEAQLAAIRRAIRLNPRDPTLGELIAVVVRP